MTRPKIPLTPSPPAAYAGRIRRQVNYTDLTPVESQVLLESRNIGRIAWNSGSGPQILPISYACVGELVFFRTSPLGLLSELVRSTHVVLEVDDLDATHHTGWSVIVHGRAQAASSSQLLMDVGAVGGVQPWAAGARNLFIGITIERITGRSFGAPWPTRALG
jgi:hypothetical protein